MRLAKYNHSIPFLFIPFLFLFYSATVRSQNSTTYSTEKEQYRVVAVKEATDRVESISNVVELIKPTTAYLPNAFTPDQDGTNDRFGVVGINVAEYQLKIFNRWGELIFESSDIANKWDGTHNGNLVPDGVYVYTLFAKELTTGKRITKTGTVTLLL
tara:strand:+ start:793 stop:1263 length:471 start_codon:yes stop_codon:yes gene_type:complete